MKLIQTVAFLLIFFSALEAEESLFQISDCMAKEIGLLVWRNECKKEVEGMLTWNDGEDFASLGIGHFIWYPNNKRGVYEEMFPELIKFFKERKVSLPSWLDETTSCPWNSKIEFQHAKEEIRYKEIKELLKATITLQAEFLAKRLQKLFEFSLEHLEPKEKNQILESVKKIAKEPLGYYALIDYVNFKGSGINESESYQGNRWGLVQVLKNMHIQTSSPPLVEFVNTAKLLLKNRVENAPAGKEEKKWLKGWYNRLDTYLIPTKEKE